MSKEQVLSVVFSKKPNVKVRVIDDSEPKEIKDDKKKYPFELQEALDVTVKTTIREFTFNIYNGYTWNGADIPKFFYRVIGSRTSNEFLIASLIHDYMLEFKQYMMVDVLKGFITVNEYRRLTSLIFREKIKAQGTSTIKANIIFFM